MNRVLTLMVGSATTAEIRQETLHGRAYTVVPVIAIVEGVLQGANSTEPELALASEFGKFPNSWDGRPVVLRHPQIQGIYVSANMPEIYEDWNMGFMFNTKLDGAKLKTEAWLDNGRIATLGGDFQETLDLINNGEIINVSVGAFIDTKPAVGEYKGRQYYSVWQNVVPDHLAILPDQVGACSVADGCGTNRVLSAASPEALQIRHIHAPCCDACSQGDPCMSKENQPTVNGGGTAPTPTPTPSPTTPSSPPPSHPSPAPSQPAPPASPTVESSLEEDEQRPEVIAALAQRGEERLQVLNDLAAMSLGELVTLDDARRAVYQALPEALGVESWAIDLMALTTEVAVVYCYGEPNLRGFHQIKYSVSNEGKVTFTGDPEPVNLMTRILPRQTVDVNSGQPNSEEVGAMTEQTGQGGNQPAPAATTQDPPAQAQPAPAEPQVNATPQSMDDFLKTVPVELRGVLSEGVSIRNQRKAALVSAIKANSRNRFTEEQLNAFELAQLENLAQLAEIPSYEGQAPGLEPLSVNQASPAAPFVAADANYLLASPEGNA